MTFGASTTVHDLLLGCPELEPYVDGLLPRAYRHGGTPEAVKWRRTTTLADVARTVNLTHPELLRALRAEAVRLGVGDAAEGADLSGEGDDVEALVALLEQGHGLAEVCALARGAAGAAPSRRSLAIPVPADGAEAPAAAPPREDETPGLKPAPGLEAPAGLEPGHPLDTMWREIEAAEQVLRMLRSALAAIERDTAEWERVRPLVFRVLDLLRGLDRHHRRAVELVCPRLRPGDRDGVSHLLGDARDAVGRLSADVRREARTGDVGAATRACRRLLVAAKESLRQEEYVLLPLAAAALGDDDWRQVRAREGAIGWTLIDAPPPWPARP